MTDVFISYSRKDRDFVRQLHNALAKLNRDTWVDWEDIPPTAEWLKEIYAGIEAADTFVFVISPDSVASETCRKEIAHAVEHHKRLAPIMRRDVPDKDVPEALRLINWIFFRESDDFDVKFQELIRALDTDLDWVKAHTRLLARAIEWQNKNLDESLLLTGRDLSEAEKWLATAATGKEPQPTQLQNVYILSSRKYERARLERESEQLANRVLRDYEEDPERGILLALAAIDEYTWTPRTELALNTSVLASRVRGYLKHNAPVASAAYSPDGARIVTAGSHIARVWDAASGKELLHLEGHQSGVTSAAFSPNGARLVTASGRTAHVWDAVSGKELLRLEGLAGNSVLAAAFSPDGARIVTASTDDTACVWDAQGGKRLLRLEGHTSMVPGAAFSPDGACLVTASWDKTARVWDAKSGKELLRLEGHTGKLTKRCRQFCGRRIGALPGIARPGIHVGQVDFDKRLLS